MQTPRPGDELSRRLESMINATRSLATIEDLDTLLEKLLVLAEEVTMAEASSYLSHSQAEGVLRFHLARNKVDGRVVKTLKSDVVLAMGEGIAGVTAKERASQLVNDAEHDRRHAKGADTLTGYRTRSILSVPVCHDEKLYGVIQVLNPAKPVFDADDVRVLESFANIAGMFIFRTELMQERLYRQQMDIQFETAAKLQSSFWPQAEDAGGRVRYWGYSRPATQVCGDMYDFFALHDGTRVCYVADVAGKGLAAALVSSALWARVRDVARPGRSAGEIMTDLNAGLFAFLSGEGLFITMVLSLVDPATGRVETACAGHHPPILAGSGQAGWLPANPGVPLGVLPGTVYESASMALAPGDSLVVYSDGVSEAFSPDHELFDDERAMDAAARADASRRGLALREAVAQWTGDHPQSDDVTILEVWRDRD